MNKITLLALALLLPQPALAAPWTITVSGTIYNDMSSPSPFGTSLMGLHYTETITTDPLANISAMQYVPGVTLNVQGASPFTITTTVNGQTYSYSDMHPLSTSAYTMTNFTNGASLFQDLNGFGCAAPAGGPCTQTQIGANLLLTVLGFDQVIQSSELGKDGSFTYFMVKQGMTYNGFYGTVESISINTPIPGALPLFASGLALLLFLKRRKAS